MIITKKKNGRRGIYPLKNLICQTISGIRQKNLQNRTRTSTNYSSLPPFASGSKEILFLGCLIYRWKVIVGPDLFRNTYPVRLIHGRLVILCSDSQWMHTLSFVKTQIMEKIRQMYPEMKIDAVQSKLGEIPREIYIAPPLNFPDWTKEKEIPLPEIQNNELAQIIQRCRKKLSSRLKGLSERGYSLCPKCGASLLPSGQNLCSQCLFQAKQSDLICARNIINEMPWISYNEVRQTTPAISNLEIDSIKSGILGESISRVSMLYSRWLESRDPSIVGEIKFEMIRSIILKTGYSPETIDLQKKDFIILFEPEWEMILGQLNREEHADTSWE